VALYDCGTFGRLNLSHSTGGNISFVHVLGAIPSGAYVRSTSCTTTFNGAASTRALDLVGVLNSSVSDVTLTNGAAGTGAGVILKKSTTSPFPESQAITLRRVRIAGNTATSKGGGVAVVDSSSLTLLDSLVESNTVSGTTNVDRGGGGTVEFGATLDVRRTIFRGNTSNGTGIAGGGGGLYVSTSGGLGVTDCLFAANSAPGGDGGGIDLSEADAGATIRDSKFLSNSSQSGGGGLRIHPLNGDVTVFNNLFVGNLGSVGGGIYVDSAASGPAVGLYSNTVAYNQVSTAATAQGGGVYNADTDTFVFDNNIVFFNDNQTLDSPLAGEPGDNVVPAALFGIGWIANNVDEGGSAFPYANLWSVPSFVKGFYLNPADASVDAGDDAADAGFGLTAADLVVAPYTTAASGAADTAPVDLGFHYENVAAAGFLTGANGSGSSCTAAATLTFTPSFTGAPLDKSGHLMTVQIASGSTATNLTALTTLAPQGAGSRLARDNGDGTYTFGADLAFGSNTFQVWADDSPTPVLLLVNCP
jgi:hypothetical protein